MKKLFAIAMAAIMAVFTGCKSVPSSGTVYALSEAVGLAAGKACEVAMEKGKFNDNARSVTLEILNYVKDAVPATNSTFTASWTPAVNEITAKYVEQGKITPTEAEMIKLATGTATKGLDYWFDERHPDWKKYKDVVASAVHGFIDGYTYVIKPVNDTLLSVPLSKREYDEEAFKYLTTK